MPTELDDWIGRVRHDLVKRFLWPARDRRDMGGAPAPGELRPSLIDEEGNPTDAASLWRALRAQAPAPLPSAAAAAVFDVALDAFAAALAAAAAAAARGDVAGVLALDGAFDALARIVKDPAAAT